MPSLLAKRIQTTLYQRFVGRKRECELFSEALIAPELHFAVLHLFGFGGVGKTTLLREFMRLCHAVHIQAIYLDVHQIQPCPAAFLNALHSTMKLEVSESPLQILTATSKRQVLIIDSYEQLTALDDWLREEFLPQLTENTLIVLAGRYSPSPTWRSAPGWQSLLSVLPLKNFSLLESQLYLVKREVPASQHQPILDFTHGHPLALSLMADLSVQGQAIQVQPTLIKTLLEKFLEKIPSPAYRTALEVCAIANFTTEALLAEILGAENSIHEWFEWLRQLSFIESGTLGLFPNNLAREVLIADLRWRHPDWYRELSEHIRTYNLTRLAQTQGQEQLPVTKAQVVFTEAEFIKAVQDALRHYDRPDVLRKSPLLRSRLVEEKIGIKAGNREQVLALQKLLKEAVDTFKVSPKENKFYHVLYRTYLFPAPTQEQAADLLNLPFSTYRRYLKTGVTRVSERLWQQESE